MNRWKKRGWVLVAGGLALCAGGAGTGRNHELHPFSDARPLELPAVPAGRNPGVRKAGDRFEVDLPVNTERKSARISLEPASGVWDVSGKLWVLVDVLNQGREPVTVRAGLKDAESQHWSMNKGGVSVPPGEQRTVPVLIIRQIGEAEENRVLSAFASARGVPGGHHHARWRQVNAGRLNLLELTFFTEGRRVNALLSGIRAAVDFELPDEARVAERYTPLLDRFGQETRRDWPLKIHENADFAARRAQEEQWLREHPPLEDRDRYGGWTAGPKLEKTGHFYPAKRDGKWWLVTPEGHLFWSFGPTGVNPGIESTRTPGLRGVMEAALEEGDRPEVFAGVEGETWSPYQANLIRKFGTDWFRQSAELSHRRLHAWGMNTVANWSSPEVFGLRRTPYTVAVHYDRATLAGCRAVYGDALPDVFHPQFKEKTFRRMEEERETTATDPWCIGYFIDNELRFPDPDTPAVEALRAPGTSYSRSVLIEQLKQRYSTLDRLNETWNTQFSEWEALSPLEGRARTDAYREDVRTFSEHYYHEYFRICRDAVRQLAPGKLYLGSRINHYRNQTAISISAEYADVVSINLYDYSPYEFRVPEGMDRPIMIGEYHFGTLNERGVWGAGLTTGMDLEHAVDLFRSYTEDALRHPLIVGAHWFKFSDQPLTGRFDGENYRIGFVDIADTPYYEKIEQSREIGQRMYHLRREAP